MFPSRLIKRKPVCAVFLKSLSLVLTNYTLLFAIPYTKLEAALHSSSIYIVHVHVYVCMNIHVFLCVYQE